jgi:hypothetical protein
MDPRGVDRLEDLCADRRKYLLIVLKKCDWNWFDTNYFRGSWHDFIEEVIIIVSIKFGHFFDSNLRLLAYQEALTLSVSIPLCLVNVSVY